MAPQGLKPVFNIRVGDLPRTVILSEEKELAWIRAPGKQILRFAQDDRLNQDDRLK
jgi:hypothetical protein